MKIIHERPWILSLILVTVIAVPGFIRVETISNKTDKVVQCISDWADATARRSAALSNATFERNEATDKLFRAAAAADRTALQQHLAEYVVASDKYKGTLRDNPVPASPELVCR
jgi:hypothetical protein